MNLNLISVGPGLCLLGNYLLGHDLLNSGVLYLYWDTIYWTIHVLSGALKENLLGQYKIQIRKRQRTETMWAANICWDALSNHSYCIGTLSIEDTTVSSVAYIDAQRFLRRPQPERTRTSRPSKSGHQTNQKVAAWCYISIGTRCWDIQHDRSI